MEQPICETAPLGLLRTRGPPLSLRLDHAQTGNWTGAAVVALSFLFADQQDAIGPTASRLDSCREQLFGHPLQKYYVMQTANPSSPSKPRRSGASCTSPLLLRTHVQSYTTSVRSAAVRRFACSAAVLRRSQPEA